jgi:hypothetical protein
LLVVVAQEWVMAVVVALADTAQMLLGSYLGLIQRLSRLCLLELKLF